MFNLFNAKDSDIDYFYTSRLPGEPLDGVDDIHLHPTLPRTARLNLVVGILTTCGVSVRLDRRQPLAHQQVPVPGRMIVYRRDDFEIVPGVERRQIRSSVPPQWQVPRACFMVNVGRWSKYSNPPCGCSAARSAASARPRHRAMPGSD